MESIDLFVCRLSDAKKLKELGVFQNSLFYYGEHLYERILTEQELAFAKDSLFKLISAFNVAELGMMLPSRIQYTNEKYGTVDYFLKYHKDSTNPRFHVEYQSEYIYPMRSSHVNLFDTYCVDKTEAGARAQMLVFLLENKVVDVEVINKRIKWGN